VVPQLIRRVAPAAVVDVAHAARVLQRRGLPARESWLHAILASRPITTAQLRYLPTATLRASSTIVDIGAHEGVWSDAALKVLAPRQLIAVEPNPASVQRLQHRLRAYEGVSVHQCAVGATRQRVEMHVTRGSNFSSLLRPLASVSAFYGEAVLPERVEPVEVKPLDDLLADIEEISLLKIDVQGSELGVFQGGARALERTRVILIEAVFAPHYEGDLSFFDLDRELRQRDFALYSLAPPFYARDGRALWSDAVYCSNNG
jgi:FkbM family methyltransferase